MIFSQQTKWPVPSQLGFSPVLKNSKAWRPLSASRLRGTTSWGLTHGLGWVVQWSWVLAVAQSAVAVVFAAELHAPAVFRCPEPLTHCLWTHRITSPASTLTHSSGNLCLKMLKLTYLAPWARDATRLWKGRWALPRQYKLCHIWVSHLSALSCGYISSKGKGYYRGQNKDDLVILGGKISRDQKIKYFSI